MPNDGFFSRVSVYLRKRDCVGRQQFITALNSCCQPRWGSRAIGFNLDYVANFSDWVNDHLADTKHTGVRQGISKFRQFKFLMRDDCVVMQVRRSCDTGQWQGLVEGQTEHKVLATSVSCFV